MTAAIQAGTLDEQLMVAVISRSKLLVSLSLHVEVRSLVAVC